MAVKVNRSNISEHLLEYQLSMIGKTVKDVLIEQGLWGEEWKRRWKYTQEDANKFKLYAIPLIKKTFKCNKSRAEGIFDFFLVNFGMHVR